MVPQCDRSIMTSWKRDFASGLVVLGPILITLFVLYWLYGFVSGLTPDFILPDTILDGLIENESNRERVTGLLRVFVDAVRPNVGRRAGGEHHQDRQGGQKRLFHDRE